jgi:hypothetical protein
MLFRIIGVPDKKRSDKWSTTVYTRGADISLDRPTSLSIFFQSMEQIVVRRGQIRRIGWVIKTLEAQVGQFLLGCKCPVSRFLPGWAKDLSVSRYMLVTWKAYSLGEVIFSPPHVPPCRQ